MNSLFGEFALRWLGEELLLLPQKALLWKKQKTLIVADVHLGKAGHFRKAGIPIPQAVHEYDLAVLQLLADSYRLEKIIFLGDLFHSDYNSEWQGFLDWMHRNPSLETVLVKGNHDILPAAVYQSSPMRVVNETLLLPPFLLSHAPLAEDRAGGHYNIAGHIHPGIRLEGRGRQAVSLPCFCFGPRAAILPAFGRFTGKANITCQEGSKVFAVAGSKVISVD